ncbi:hypothetical protein T05_9737, partial [Trichinella murrelli]
MEKVYDTACSQTVSDSGTDVSPTLLNFADRAGCGAFNVIGRKYHFQYHRCSFGTFFTIVL